MSEIKVGIKIEADSSKGQAALTTLEGSLRNVGGSAKRVSQDIGNLHAGWAKLNSQFAQQSAAKVWTDQLAQASAGAQRLKQSIDTTTQAARKQEQSLQSWLGFWAKVHMFIMGGQQLAGFAKGLAQTADTYTNLNSRLKLVSGTTQELARAQQASFAIAQSYNMALDDTGRLYTRLAPIAQNLGRSQSDLITLMSGVGAAMKVSGATAAEAGSTITQLTQSLAAATVQGADFNLLYDTAPAIVRAVEKELSRLVQQYGSLKNAMEKGAVSNQMLFDVLVKTSAEFQRQAATMSLTVGGALQNLTNAWTRYIGETDQAKGSSRDLADGLQRLANNIDTVMYIPSKIVNGWGLLAEGIERAVKATRELFSLQPNAGVSTQMAELQKYRDQYVENQAISREEWEARKKNNQGYFDSIRRGADAAASALHGLSSEQQRVANQIIEAAKAAKLDPALALAIGYTESRFNEKAIGNPTRYGRAKGAMQMLDANSKAYGVANPLDISQQAPGAVKMLKELQGEFKTLTHIAAAYNAGPGNVRNDKWMRFAETRDYVEKIADAYKRFKGELGQDEGFNVAREQFDSLRDATQRYIANLDDQAKAAQRQAEIAVSGIDNQIAALDRERDAWDKAQQDKIDAAKGSYDEMARLEAERAAKLQDYAARELALIQQQYDARKQAMDAAASAFRKQLDSPNKLSDDEERRAKQGLADIQADLVKLANDRAQAEAKAGQAAMEANRGGLELAQKQQEFIAGINADLEFQKQLYLQLKAAKESGASTEGLAILRATAERSGQLPGAVSQAEIQRTEQAIAQTKIYEQEIANLTQSAQDRAESVREQQLRENAYWDQLMGRTESLANLWTQIYGAQAAGMANLTVAMARYSKDVEQIQQRWNDPNTKKQWGDMSGLMEGLQQAQAGAVALSETMLAIRSTTEQGTKAYEDLTTAAGNFAIMGQWLNIVEGIGAVIHQLRDGEVYTAIPRALGVAAMVASMGVQTGVIGGAGTQNATAKYSDGSNKGVFGDTTAASESITKSLEIIRDNSSNDLNYSAAMLRALEGIEAAMGGVTNTIIRGVQPAAFKAGVVMTHGDIVDPGGLSKMDPILSFMNKLMFNITRRVSDFGLAATSQALSAILKQGFSGSVYTDIETSTKVLGMTVAKSVKTVFQDMDPAIAKQFTLAFQSISTAIVEGGKAFGLTAEDFAQRMRGFIIDIEKMSTKDMTGEELQKKVSQMFSEQSDRMARRFMPGLGKFQQVGEGYFQTFVRVAEAVNRAGGELERLGIKAISYRNIERKQADIAAEIVRESLLQQTGLADGVRQYVKELTGSAEDLIDAYKKLKEATQGLRTAGLGTNVTRAEINAGGGLDAYTQNLQTYLDKFLTPGENLVGQWQNIGDAFTALGLKMPTTNAEFRKMVEGIDTSTEAGQKLRGAVLALAPGFADLASAMDDAKSALQSAYDTAKQQAQGLRDYLNSLKTGDASTGTGLDRYSAAKKIYEKTLEDANKGDPKAIAALQGVSSTFLELSKKYFAASGQYATDLASVQTGLGSLAGAIENDIKTAEDQYTWLKANTDALTSLADAMKAYETTLAKVNGIQSSQTGQSVNDANAANTDASVKEKEAKAYEDKLAKLMQGVRQAYSQGQTKKAKEIRAEIERYIAEIQASGIYFVTWDGKRHDVSYRAMGGYTPPGWAVVGERGPELVNFTRPSRVYTATETRAALSDSPALLDRIENAAKAGIKVDQAGYQALLAELQAIRAEMEEQTRAQKMAAAA